SSSAPLPAPWTRLSARASSTRTRQPTARVRSPSGCTPSSPPRPRSAFEARGEHPGGQRRIRTHAPSSTPGPVLGALDRGFPRAHARPGRSGRALFVADHHRTELSTGRNRALTRGGDLSTVEV